MVRALALAALAAAWLAGNAAAAPAVVEAVQYPAWLERGGHAVPLAPGIALQARDRLRTGPGARVRLKLPEGSAVKLGENARFEIARAEDRGTYRAALAVIAGAFRFTTDALAKRKRDVAIRVKHVTVGVRGTDLWGKAADDLDFVVLLEGRITVAAEGEAPRALERPLEAFETRPGAAGAVRAVDAARVQELARETELDDAGAQADGSGGWRAVAGLAPTRDAALALQRTVRAAGYPATIVARDGYFAVQVAGLSTEAAARAAVAGFAGLAGIANPSVQRE